MAHILYVLKQKAPTVEVKSPSGARVLRLKYDEILQPHYEVHFADSFLRFLQSTRTPDYIRQLFYDMANNGTPERNTTFLNLSEGKELSVNAFALRRGAEPLISFLPRAKMPKKDDKKRDMWALKERQLAKPGKWLHSVINQETLNYYGISESVIEKFTNAVKSYVELDVRIKEVKGPFIEWWYNPAHHSERVVSGSNLTTSCMAKTAFEISKFELYTDNPNVRLLVALDKKQRLLGRAILWSSVTIWDQTVSSYSSKYKKVAENVTFMDRIFSGDDYIEDLFREYARERGYWQRTLISAKNKDQVTDPKGNHLSHIMTVPTSMTEWHQEYPYLDTFTYLAHDMSELCNSPVTPAGQKTYSIESAPKKGIVRQASVMTDLDGPTPAYLVHKCDKCGQTGNVQNMSMYKEGAVLPDDPPYACTRCAYKYFIPSHTEGYLILSSTAVRVATPSGEGYDYVSPDNVIKSKHEGKNLIKSMSRYLPVEQDWVSRNAKIVPSDFHGGFLLEGNAVFVEELDTYVHRSHLREAEARVKELAEAKANGTQDSTDSKHEAAAATALQTVTTAAGASSLLGN